MIKLLLIISIFILIITLLMSSDWCVVMPDDYYASHEVDMMMVQVSIDAFYSENKRYPASIRELTTPIPYITSRAIMPLYSYGYSVCYFSVDAHKYIMLSTGPDFVYSEWKRGKEENAINYLFDSTNGTKSSGDMVKFRGYSELRDIAQDITTEFEFSGHHTD